MRTRARFWRWRRNPLRRRSDVAEAWVVLTTGLLLAVGAPAVGAVVGLDMQAAAARQGQDWHPTAAVVVEDAPYGGYLDRVRTEVRWTASDGASRTERALVRSGSEAGARATVWLDDAGALHDPPLTDGQAAVEGVVFGTSATVVTRAVVLAGGWGARVRLDRRRQREWEREWASVGPRWGRRPA
ncbi:hypothetical protein [Streptomyces sp. MMBL 11-3]|uniref:Rv1733c family protein n=1 Tax=Streptomyces sp. MMBL 11-3 TaxID=3382639 RepID=UPI0039B50D41